MRFAGALQLWHPDPKVSHEHFLRELDREEVARRLANVVPMLTHVFLDISDGGAEDVAMPEAALCWEIVRMGGRTPLVVKDDGAVWK